MLFKTLLHHTLERILRGKKKHQIKTAYLIKKMLYQTFTNKIGLSNKKCAQNVLVLKIKIKGSIQIGTRLFFHQNIFLKDAEFEDLFNGTNIFLRKIYQVRFMVMSVVFLRHLIQNWIFLYLTY